MFKDRIQSFKYTVVQSKHLHYTIFLALQGFNFFRLGKKFYVIKVILLVI